MRSSDPLHHTHTHKGCYKTRRCVENSDRNRIWSKKWFLYKESLNNLVLQIVGVWVRFCREMLPHAFLWWFLTKHPVRGTMQNDMALWSETLQEFSRVESILEQPFSPIGRKTCVFMECKKSDKGVDAVKWEYSVVATGQSFWKCRVFGSCCGYCEQSPWASFRDSFSQSCPNAAFFLCFLLRVGKQYAILLAPGLAELFTSHRD